jgi:hypothetical protein
VVWAAQIVEVITCLPSFVGIVAEFMQSLLALLGAGDLCGNLPVKTAWQALTGF